MENHEKKYEEGCSKECPCQAEKYSVGEDGIVSRVVFSTGESYTISEVEPDIYRYTYTRAGDKSYSRDRSPEGEKAGEILPDPGGKP